MWYKRYLPLVLVFLIGLLGFLTQYIPHWGSEEVVSYMARSLLIIVAFAMFIGAYSLLHMHLTRIRRQQAGWAYSLLVFVGATVMIAAGLYNEGTGPMPPLAPRGINTWLYDHVQVPCSATMFSILAFFIASAAYRTFRAKNLNALLLLIAAVIVMFGQVTISERFVNWGLYVANLFPPLHDFIVDGLGVTDTIFRKLAHFVMAAPNMAAKRGIMLGIALGAISQSLRILFGIERSYMGGGD